MHLAIEHLPARGRPEQLLLLLHGWAQEAQALAPLADALHAEFPQAAVLVPESATPADGGRRGRMWYSIEGLQQSLDTWPARVAEQLLPLQAWVLAQQQRLGVGAAATCLGGFSQGAMLSLELVARHDGIAGRVLAFGGRFVTRPSSAAPHHAALLPRQRRHRVPGRRAQADPGPPGGAAGRCHHRHRAGRGPRAAPGADRPCAVPAAQPHSAAHLAGAGCLGAAPARPDRPRLTFPSPAMLYLLSPAKSLDYDTPVPAATRRKATDPLFPSRRPN
jgi:predicted esterase